MSAETASSAAAVDPVTFVRPEIRQLKRYSLDLPSYRHKLDQNEMPFDVPRRLKKRLCDRICERSWAIYPDFHADDLRRALGELHGWPSAGVLVGNGSDELLTIAVEALSRPGGEVLGTVPSFGLYRMFIARAAAVARLVGPAMTLPLAELEAEIERDPTRPVILCTPNNPTGDAASADAVDSLLAKLRAPLLLDNAYGEFCAHDYRPLLARHRHLLIFRTFSKAWSLAGLRLGYVLGDPELLGELIKAKQPYNINFASAMIGETILAERDAARRRIAVVRGRRPQWQAMLAELGFEVFPSEANFVLFRCPRETPGAGAIRRGLAERGIRIRDVSSYPGLDECLRTAVGNGRALRDTRQALIEILEDR